MRIQGRTAIVTGASSGIGRETARELARQGANVVLAARSRDRLERLAADLSPLPGRPLVAPTDVSDRLAVEGLVRRAVEEFGSVDILVNNAGVGLFAPIVGGSLDNMHHLFAVNFWGAVHCIQAAVPYMRAQRRGHIVNVSSVAGRVAPPYMGIYAATKSALASLSDSLRAELAGRGIAVTTVFPGFTETAFPQNMLREGEPPELPRALRFVPASTVARRIAQAVRWGLRDAYVSPEDVAAVAVSAALPQLADLSFRLFWPARPISQPDYPQPPSREEPEPSTADAEPPESA